MEVNGIKVYPLVSMKNRAREGSTTIQDSATITLSSWVRIKRKKKYYLVLVCNTGEFTEVVPYKLFELINYHLTNCEILYHLWLIPSKDIRKRLIENNSLIKDNQHLSNKDLVLYREQPFNI